MSPQDARELAQRAVEFTAADQAEALVTIENSALTRFANNRIHQNVAENNVSIQIRAVLGGSVGVASTERTDDESLRAAAGAAVAAAQASAADPDFPGLPAPQPITPRGRVSAAALGFGPQARANAAAELIDASRRAGLSAAGTVAVGEHAIAVANSLGVDAVMPYTGCSATVLAMGERSGSGWASFLDRGPEGLDALAMGAEAADLALRSADPGDLEPGEYTVVLAPDAVADLVDYLGYVGFSAKAFAEGRSFMSNAVGRAIMSEGVRIIDDALADTALGPVFDFEGMPRRRVELIERGRVGEPVTDSYWAAKLGRDNTGHALMAPNSFGPMPLNLELEAGSAGSIDDLIAEVRRGVYVTRFHYTNVEDPMTVLLTGMTRDGTFMIENGRLGRPLKNQRFNQSAIEALRGVLGATAARRHIGLDENSVYAPALLLERFRFTGQTS